MGRHSAPDEVDDDAVEIDSPLAVLDLGEDRGRHASADDEAEGDSVASADRATSDQATAEFDEAHTQRLAVVDAPPLETPTKSDTKADKKAAKASARRRSRPRRLPRLIGRPDNRLIGRLIGRHNAANRTRGPTCACCASNRRCAPR